ncbi:helix-turn-helix domain-containing protein [Pedobacter sp. Leaf132]|uniref:helix-turn-helix domain-containing protein n=1 Tax=Pedobacter sp. Leaf132 TaxID=2876557 RepID=UPI001E5DB0FC|nr:helix-turn-helix transcriptional regulator [Pedobacter sp. Leaf132]
MNTSKQCNGEAISSAFDSQNVGENLSHNLKLIRKQKGFTQEEFSSQLSISRPAYASYEEQRALPSLAVVIIISNLTGIDINTLLEDKLGEEVHND